MNNSQILADKNLYEKKYAAGRSNLLVMIAFTLINVVMCLFKSTSYFLFSAQFPYYLVYASMWWGGKMPDEAYIESFGETKEEFAFLPHSVYVAFVVLAFAVILFYVCCWIFSKYRSGWLTTALVLFILDTLMMALLILSSFEVSALVDLAFHIWMIVYLVNGVSAARKLAKLPDIPDDPEVEVAVEEPAPVSSLNGEATTTDTQE